MPVANVRVVVNGVPRAGKAFEVVLIDKREALKLAEELAREGRVVSDDLSREIARLVRGV